MRKDIRNEDSAKSNALDTFTGVTENAERGMCIENPLFKGAVNVGTTQQDMYIVGPPFKFEIFSYAIVILLSGFICILIPLVCVDMIALKDRSFYYLLLAMLFGLMQQKILIHLFVLHYVNRFTQNVLL
jgi:hypothetical protein